jgi:hypothetical protein
MDLQVEPGSGYKHNKHTQKYSSWPLPARLDAANDEKKGERKGGGLSGMSARKGKAPIFL